MDPSQEPWYQDGLRFRCTMCGHCCTGEPGFVWVDEGEVAAIAEFRGETEDQVVAKFIRKPDRRRSLVEKENGDCIFFDRSRGCTIYPVRPKQCRTWPFWESTLRTPRTWRLTCDVCPGSGKGDLIPVEEITRRVRVIKI